MNGLKLATCLVLSVLTQNVLSAPHYDGYGYGGNYPPNVINIGGCNENAKLEELNWGSYNQENEGGDWNMGGEWKNDGGDWNTGENVKWIGGDANWNGDGSEWKGEGYEWKGEGYEWKGDETEWKGDGSEWKSDGTDFKGIVSEWNGDGSEWKGEGTEMKAEAPVSEDGTQALVLDKVQETIVHEQAPEIKQVPLADYGKYNIKSLRPIIVPGRKGGSLFVHRPGPIIVNPAPTKFYMPSAPVIVKPYIVHRPSPVYVKPVIVNRHKPQPIHVKPVVVKVIKQMEPKKIVWDRPQKPCDHGYDKYDRYDGSNGNWKYNGKYPEHY